MASNNNFDSTKCPVCGNIAGSKGNFSPFCSDRCRQVDLGIWFSEGYSIPAVDPPDDIESLLDKLGEG